MLFILAHIKCWINDVGKKSITHPYFLPRWNWFEQCVDYNELIFRIWTFFFILKPIPILWFCVSELLTNEIALEEGCLKNASCRPPTIANPLEAIKRIHLIRFSMDLLTRLCWLRKVCVGSCSCSRFISDTYKYRIIGYFPFMQTAVGRYMGLWVNRKNVSNTTWGTVICSFKLSSNEKLVEFDTFNEETRYYSRRSHHEFVPVIESALIVKILWCKPGLEGCLNLWPFVIDDCIPSCVTDTILNHHAFMENSFEHKTKSRRGFSWWCIETVTPPFTTTIAKLIEYISQKEE